MKTFFWCCLLGTLFFSCNTENNDPHVPSPLFIDPNYHGSCDPEVVWNEAKQRWFIYYTARRPALDNTWLQTPIGVISSENLIDWTFEGYCKFDGKEGKKDANATFWAPAIIYGKGKLHMFVTFKSDTLPENGAWGGPGAIVHYETDLDNPVEAWKKVAVMHDSTLNTIDATVFCQGETYHLWYKGKIKGKKKNELYHLTSHDLYDWAHQGFSKSEVFNAQATGHEFEEAPYIFQWKNMYWLLTDPHQGLLVYSSEEGNSWDFQGKILKEGGKRELDNNRARHCSVAVVKDRAFIFYHVEPWRRYDLEEKKGENRVPIFKQALNNRRSVLQMAELEVRDGKLFCDRNKEVRLD